MTANDFSDFLAEHTTRMEPMARETNLAYWNATTTGDSQFFARYETLEVERQRIYSDRESYARLESWQRQQAPADAIGQRALNQLCRDYRRYQINPSLLQEMTRLSTALTQRFGTFRAEVDGEKMTGNAIRDTLRTSTDSARRRAVWEADKRVGGLVRDGLLELVAMRNDAARSLGFDDFYVMSLALDEQDEGDLFRLFDRLDTFTRAPFAEMKSKVDAALADRSKASVGELRPWHYEDPFFQESPRVFDVDFDRYYEGQDIVALVTNFFEGIGLEVRDILKSSDLFEKPGKDQHAYCIDIDRTGDIRILANVRDDENWTGTMLHELGHAVYDAYVDPALPWLLREHAHIFVTEAIAMLFGRLSKDPTWMQAMLGLSDAQREEIARVATHQQRLGQLVFARWCQVMVRFERELYRNPSQDLNTLWWDLVEHHQMLKRPEGRNEPDWASKIHAVTAPVYYHNYMLGELLASQLDHQIRQKFGDGAGSLVGCREAGEYLRQSVFRPGRRMRWDRLIEQATGEPLTPDYFVAQFVS